MGGLEGEMCVMPTIEELFEGGAESSVLSRAFKALSMVQLIDSSTKNQQGRLSGALVIQESWVSSSPSELNPTTKSVEQVGDRWMANKLATRRLSSSAYSLGTESAAACGASGLQVTLQSRI